MSEQFWNEHRNTPEFRGNSQKIAGHALLAAGQWNPHEAIKHLLEARDVLEWNLRMVCAYTRGGEYSRMQIDDVRKLLKAEVLMCKRSLWIAEHDNETGTAAAVRKDLLYLSELWSSAFPKEPVPDESAEAR